MVWPATGGGGKRRGVASKSKSACFHVMALQLLSERAVAHSMEGCAGCYTSLCLYVLTSSSMQVRRESEMNKIRIVAFPILLGTFPYNQLHSSQIHEKTFFHSFQP